MNTRDFNKQCYGKAKLVKCGPNERHAIENVIYSLWRDQRVGIGKDAKNLRHQDIKIIKIQKLKNPDLQVEYKMYKDSLPRRKTCRKRERYQKIEELESLVDGARVFSRGAVHTDRNPVGIFKNLRQSVNEHYLLHGCPPDAAEGILENGFNPKRSNPGAMFGQGSYFAENPTKADQYAGKY